VKDAVKNASFRRKRPISAWLHKKIRPGTWTANPPLKIPKRKPDCLPVPSFFKGFLLLNFRSVDLLHMKSHKENKKFHLSKGLVHTDPSEGENFVSHQHGFHTPNPEFSSTKILTQNLFSQPFIQILTSHMDNYYYEENYAGRFLSSPYVHIPNYTRPMFLILLMTEDM